MVCGSFRQSREDIGFRIAYIDAGGVVMARRAAVKHKAGRSRRAVIPQEGELRGAGIGLGQRSKNYENEDCNA